MVVSSLPVSLNLIALPVLGLVLKMVIRIAKEGNGKDGWL